MMITSVFVRAFFMHSLCKTADSNMFPNVILPLSENKAAFLKKTQLSSPLMTAAAAGGRMFKSNICGASFETSRASTTLSWQEKKKKKQKHLPKASLKIAAVHRRYD